MSILNRRIDLSPLRFTVVDEPFRFRHLALQFPQIERSQSIGHFLGPCCAAIDRLSISLNPRTDALVHGLARYGARPTNRARCDGFVRGAHAPSSTTFDATGDTRLSTYRPHAVRAARRSSRYSNRL